MDIWLKFEAFGEESTRDSVPESGSSWKKGCLNGFISLRTLKSSYGSFMESYLSAFLPLYRSSFVIRRPKIDSYEQSVRDKYD